MKIQGKKLSNRGHSVIRFNRPDMPGGVLELRQAPVLNDDDFEAMCPVLKPPLKVYPDGRKEEDPDNQAFKDKVAERRKIYSNWLIYQALQVTPGIVFETIKKSDPKSFLNVESELREAGFTVFERGQIAGEVNKINGLFDDERERQAHAEKRMAEARAGFTEAPDAGAAVSTFPGEGPAST